MHLSLVTLDFIIVAHTMYVCNERCAMHFHSQLNTITVATINDTLISNGRALDDAVYCFRFEIVYISFYVSMTNAWNVDTI